MAARCDTGGQDDLDTRKALLEKPVGRHTPTRFFHVPACTVRQGLACYFPCFNRVNRRQFRGPPVGGARIAPRAKQHLSGGKGQAPSPRDRETNPQTIENQSKNPKTVGSHHQSAGGLTGPFSRRSFLTTADRKNRRFPPFRKNIPYGDRPLLPGIPLPSRLIAV